MRTRFSVLIAIFIMFAALLGGTSSGADRFVDNGDGTVSDNQTGLMWQKTDDGTKRNWDDAGMYCENLVLGSYDDWRVPRIDELLAVVDYGVFSPASDPVFGSRSNYYWSGSTPAFNPDVAWSVYFGNGNAGWPAKTGTYYVRCVRGGPFWPFDPLEFFEVHTEDSIIDLHHNLIWQKSDDGTRRAWDAAQAYCEALGLDGNMDWRLPDIQELQTIIDFTAYKPALSTETFDGRSS
jgi:hypothetical protein